MHALCLHFNMHVLVISIYLLIYSVLLVLALLVLSSLNTSKVSSLDTCFTQSFVVLFQYSLTVCEYIDLKPSNICWK